MTWRTDRMLISGPLQTRISRFRRGATRAGRATTARQVIPDRPLNAQTGVVQGTVIAVLFPRGTVGSVGPISIQSQTVANAVQMNADGRTVEVGSTVPDYAVAPLFSVTFAFTDAVGSWSVTLDFAVDPATSPLVVGNPPTAINLTAGVPYAGYDFKANFQDRLGFGLSYAILPALPTGLTFTNGAIDATTPVSSSAARDYTISAVNTRGESADIVFTLAVASAAVNTAPSVNPQTIAAFISAGSAPSIPTVSGASFDDLTWQVTFNPTIAGNWHAIVNQTAGAMDPQVVKDTAALTTANAYGTGTTTTGAQTKTLTEQAVPGGQNYLHLVCEGAVGAFSTDTVIAFKPQVRYLGEVSVGGANATPSLDLTPLGMRVGDTLLVNGSSASNTTRNVGTSSAGFSDAFAKIVANDTYDCNFLVQYKVMTSTPDTSIVMRSNGTTTSPAQLTARAYRYVDNTTPLDVTPTTATAIDGLLANPPSITTVTDKCFLSVWGMGARIVGDSTTYSSSDLSDFTATYASATSHGMPLGRGHMRQTVAGAFDPAAFTGATTTASDSWAACTIAMRQQQ